MDTLLGAWLELGAAGLVAGAGACVRLRALDRRERWRRALAAAPGGREALLVATCDDSDAPWAHLVRAFLLQPNAARGEPYREAGALSSPRGAFGVQRRRVALAAGLAVAGAGAIAASSASASGVDDFGWFAVFLAGATCAILVIGGLAAFRALSTLREAATRLPELVRGLPPGEASEDGSASGPIAQVRGGGGALLLFGVPTAIVLLALGISATVRLAASDARGFAGALVMTVFVPVEILRGVRLEERRAARGASWDVVIDVAPHGHVVCLSWSEESEARQVVDAVRAHCRTFDGTGA